MWQEALATLLESYSPCSDLKESTHQFSTGDIQLMLSQHTGGSVNAEELVKTLKDRGFIYIRTGDLSLEWIMVQKEITE